jgi:hypothetical protein
VSIAIKILWSVLALSLLLGIASLATWGIPAPAGEVKITFSNDRFFKKAEETVEK